MTSISTQSTTGVQLPKTLRNLVEAAIATAAIALIANVSAASATTEQSPPSQAVSEASALQSGVPLRASFGYGMAPLEGDIDPNEATRRRVAADTNRVGLDPDEVNRTQVGRSSSLGPVIQLVEIEF
ncbi:MAG: hypothetical protein WBA10_11480 [Elainellaceae cyanobacterium]